MAEKIEKLENFMREGASELKAKETKIQKMEEEMSKLERKVKALEEKENRTNMKDSDNSRSLPENESVNENSSKKFQENTVKLKELSQVVKENRDMIVETGRQVVDIREDIVKMKDSEDGFQVVKGRKAAKKNKETKDKGITVSNRFAVLSQEETFIIGDSIIEEQRESFANMNKRKRKVLSFPRCTTSKVSEEIKKLDLQSKESVIITHVGSNELFTKDNRTGNSEPIVKDLKNLVDTMAEKTNRGIIVGMFPRRYVNRYAHSKAIAINERISKYCLEKKITFLDMWDKYIGNWHYYKKDGIHLSELGNKVLEKALTKAWEEICTNSTEDNGTGSKKVPEEKATTTKVVDENPQEQDGLGNFFEGFPKGN